ncbi:MAG: calcium/sodium antiporter [Bacteroidales bacterium]|nr:calcium/sodium antiporter [Bacteroidales bacterium]
MIIPFLLVVLGFALLIMGASWLVSGASSLARKFRVSELAIGLTIVAFGTSAPELVVNIVASANGFSDIVLGNIIGSNNFNLFIILGLSGIILPVVVQSSTAWKEIPLSLIVALAFLLLANNFFISDEPVLSRLDGGILFILFLFFLYYVFTQMRKEEKKNTDPVGKSAIFITGLIILGLSGLIFGGQLVVMNSIKIAANLGISEKVIGLTIVAAGTSLPELVTSVVAALKRKSDLAIGNVIGSNIFNILLILPVSTFIHPIPYSKAFNTDIYILIGGTAFLILSMITGKRKRLDRWEAMIMLGFFLIYTIFIVMNEM